MSRLFIILGILILNTPAVLACNGQTIRNNSDHSAFSREYANGNGKLGLPPGPGSPNREGGGSR